MESGSKRRCASGSDIFVEEENWTDVEEPDSEESDWDLGESDEDDLLIEDDLQPDVIFASDTETEEPMESTSEANFVQAKSGMKWFTNPVPVTRSSTSDITQKRLELTARSSSITTIEETFKLFITPEIIEKLVDKTNRKAEYLYGLKNANNPENKKTWTRTASTEMQAYIGLLLTQGATHDSKESVKTMWTADSTVCRPIYPATMSRSRFSALTSLLRFDDFTTRQQRKGSDKLAAIRDVFNMFVVNCNNSMTPGKYLCVDEQLVGFRGRAPFRVHMKNKPDKYGIKIWMLADTDVAYIHNLQVYLGKEGNKPEKEQAKRVVLDLTQYLQPGHGITTDNFFTSIPLADKLLERGLTLCGTIRKNKAEIPVLLLPNRKKELYYSQFLSTKTNTLVSYVPKKNKAVILLSTEHHDNSISSEDNNYKPYIVLHYNSTKGGVDTVDKLAKEYSTKRRSLRWPMVIFYNLLDLVGINAFAV